MAINLRSLEKQNLGFKIISRFAFNYDKSKEEEYVTKDAHIPSVYHFPALLGSKRSYGNTLLVPVNLREKSLLEFCDEEAKKVIKAGSCIVFPEAAFLIEHEGVIYKLKYKRGFLYLASRNVLSSIPTRNIQPGQTIADAFKITC